MPIKRGTVVLCLKGKDKGCLAAVLTDSDTAVLIADGKRRPLEHPKHKNRKHISVSAHVLSDFEMATNKSLRRALNALATANQ